MSGHRRDGLSLGNGGGTNDDRHCDQSPVATRANKRTGDIHGSNSSAREITVCRPDFKAANTPNRPAPKNTALPLKVVGDPHRLAAKTGTARMRTNQPRANREPMPNPNSQNSLDGTRANIRRQQYAKRCQFSISHEQNSVAAAKSDASTQRRRQSADGTDTGG